MRKSIRRQVAGLHPSLEQDNAYQSNWFPVNGLDLLGSLAIASSAPESAGSYGFGGRSVGFPAVGDV